MRTRGCCAGLVIAVLWGSPAVAGEREQEIERAEKRIEMLLVEAEELQRAGRPEEAERHRREAEELRAKLRAHLAAREREPRDAKDLEKILAGLEHGLEALRRLGGHEEARERLELAMRDVRRELEARERRHAEVEGYAQALQLAHRAMTEMSETGDAIEQIKRAVHAAEIRKAGRKDPEAREIMERAPRPEQLARIFAAAAEFYRDVDKPDRADICARWARELKGAPDREPEAVAYAQALRFAHAAMREAKRGDAAELVERALHAQELKATGRRDAEAREIIGRAPRPEHLAWVFAEASRLYRDWGNPDRADICARWARQADVAPDRERETAARDLEVLHIAMHGLREAEKPELAGKVEHAIHAYELRMARRRDDEALQVMRTAPGREQMVELLGFSATLWKKFGNAEHAAACASLAERWRDHRPPDGERRGDGERLREIEQRLTRLERSLAEIERLLRERR